MTEEATQVPDVVMVMGIIIAVFLGTIALICFLENNDFISLKQSIISKKWLFRKHKYKIVKGKEGRYNVYQQTKLGFWYLLDYYYDEEAAKNYIYRRYKETIEENTKYVKYITLESETDPTRQIESKNLETKRIDYDNN